MRARTSMLATIAFLVCVLCAHSAVGEDANVAFCDTLDGMMNSTFSWDEEFRVGKYIVVRAMQPTKPPGAVRCVAYGYGVEGDTSNDMESSILYTCQWNSSSPRSTFEDFGTRLNACLERQGYSSRPSVGDGPFIGEDQGDRFGRSWDGKNPEIYLWAYKMSGKGVFLRVRNAGIRNFARHKRRIERWLEQHRKALVNFQTCVGQEQLSIRSHGAYEACSEKESEGEHIYSSSNPYRGSLGSVLAHVDESVLMTVFKPEDIKQLRDIDQDFRQYRLRIEEAGRLWINGGQNAGEVPD